MIFEYLIFNALILIGPLLSAFFYKHAVIPKLKPALKSIFLVAIVFIIWDHFVTDVFWKFNNNFITGIRIGRLPIEEIMFFISVPFACLFLWVNYQLRFDRQKMISSPRYIKYFMVLIFFLSGYFIYIKTYYTGSVFIIFFLTVLLDMIIKTRLFIKEIFWKFSGIVLMLTFFWNLYLTARPVVIYNPAYKTGINLITIPVEDFLYGLVMVSLILIIYQFLTDKKNADDF